MKETFLGVDVCGYNYDELAAILLDNIEKNKKSFLVAINPEKIMKAQDDEKLKTLLNQADYQIPDGFGVILASKLKGGQVKSRVTGIDMMMKICEVAATHNKRIFLYGGKPGIADAAKVELEKLYPGIQIVGTLNGYEKEEQVILNTINENSPHIIFVALGSPTQEYWIVNHMDSVSPIIFQGVGGSFDVISGNLKRAPRFFQRLGLEWFYRLLKEPWRWKKAGNLTDVFGKSVKKISHIEVEIDGWSTTLSSIVDNLLKQLRTSKFYGTAKNNKVLRSIKTKYDKSQYSKRQESVHIHGLKTLQIMKEAFAEIGHDFWLDYGTLLGSVREKDFIGHDKDLDIGTFNFDDTIKKKLESILKAKGLKKYKQYEMDGKIFEEAYHYNGVHIDIFYYHKAEENLIWCYFSEIGTKMEFENFPEYQLAKGYLTHKVVSHFDGLMDYEFKGDTFKIPINYHEYLVDNYGTTYMQVRKDWSSGTEPTNITFVPTDSVTVREYIGN